MLNVYDIRYVLIKVNYYYLYNNNILDWMVAQVIAIEKGTLTNNKDQSQNLDTLSLSLSIIVVCFYIWS